MPRALHLRPDKGQGIVVLTALIAILILFAVGLFAYEVNRVEVCRTQLRSACEAASLAAAATLASQDNLDPTDAHNQAVETAINTFEQNSVAGISLRDTTLATEGDYAPNAERSSLFIEFLDPNENNEPVALGDPKGKLVKITAAFGLKPSFGSFLGLPTVPLQVTASGGVPELDVVLCFDVSGSIDDQAPVTFVKRIWSGSTSTGRIVYQKARTRSGSPVQPYAEGRIFDIIGPVPSGTRVNGVPPQYLGSSNQSDVRWPLNFCEESSSTRRLRGTSGNETGSRPGNYPGNSTISGTGDNYTYTDLVVNIDGRNQFAGITTADGYSFPDIGTVVEAARGNLESDTVFTNSGANRSLPASVSPRLGYKAKYLELAAKHLHPLVDAQGAAAEFFTVMNTNTRGHFGVVCFSDNAGSSSTTTYSAARVDTSWSGAGNGSFPIPNISLNPAEGATNYDAIQAMLPTTVATTATNIGDALDKAVTQLTTRNRPGSKKAIVLFTDGMPTAGQPLHSNPETNARRGAKRAKDAGIPIYSIGLAQNPEIVPYEVEILTDANSNVNTGGVSGIAGNGGKFFLVTDVADLRKTFENIARQLVQLVKT